MRFASLGSGSRGNATLVDDGDTCILVDLGFSLAETRRRLLRLGIIPEDITAIVVTHEHTDHTRGVAGFARKYDVPVYLSHGTCQGMRLDTLAKAPRLQKISSHSNFTVNGMQLVPVAVPHDAREPCQYLLRSGASTLGILTDLGHITPHVVARYRECDALLLECNHDADMLREGPYPYPLKVRVGGDYGHLNNLQAAQLLRCVDLAKLRHLIIAHISAKNNLPELALSAIAPCLDGWCGKVALASQDQGFGWVSLP